MTFLRVARPFSCTSQQNLHLHQGRKALVTGGSKGIGRETTELFLSLGAEARPCKCS